MARLLKDTCETARQIMDGELDADLDYIAQACKARLKMRFLRGQIVRLVGTRNVALEGKTAVITKVNAKTISVGIGEPVTEFGHTYYPDGEYNVSPGLLEAVA